MLEQSTHFGSEAVNSGLLRRALGHFATGVTLVTAQSDIGPLGFTANSFSSVSLTPPLLQWSLARASRRHDTFAKAQHFAVHILAEDQKDLALEFARRGDAFDVTGWSADANGVPVLDQALARFDCQHHAAYPAGDHTLILGEVLGVSVTGGTGLIFDQGRYGHFNPSAM